MKTLISALTLFTVLCFYSTLTFAGQYTFESLMPYQKDSCIDDDRVVLMSNMLTSAVQAPVSLDGQTWNDVILRPGERKVFITSMSLEGMGQIKLVKQRIFIKLNNSLELEGGQFYVLDSSGDSVTVSRVPTFCQQGRLVQSQ
jgi:hypothetical protein